MVANSEGLDLYRYQHWIETFQYDLLSWSDFPILLSVIVMGKGESMDLYREIMTFLVSRFTSDGHILMLCFGTILGLAFVKTLNLLFSISNKLSFWGGIILFCYAFGFGLDWLGGVRFGTAAYMYLIGVLFYITEKKKQAYIFFLISIFVHLGFVVGIFILFLYRYLYSHTKQIYTFLLISICLAFSAQLLFSTLADIIGGRVSEVMNSYVSSDFKEYASGIEVPWYSRYHDILFLAFVYSFLLWANKFNRFKESDVSRKASIFLLSSLIAVNLFSFSPIFSRFISLCCSLFFIYLYFVYANNRGNIKLQKCILFSLCFYFLHIVNSLRYIFEYTTPDFYSPFLPQIISSKTTLTMWSFLFGS